MVAFFYLIVAPIVILLAVWFMKIFQRRRDDLNLARDEQG
jgi:hypothetical protein